MFDNANTQAYDRLAPHYRKYAQKRSSYLDSIDDLIVENIKPGGRCLDIGTGDGYRLHKIAAQACFDEMVAVEASPGMIEACHQQTGMRPIQAYAQNLDPAELGQFDTIMALWNVWGHIPSTKERVQALHHVKSMLKPEGQFFMDVQNRHNMAAYDVPRAIVNVIVDSLGSRNETRGDVEFDWDIEGEKYPAKGHFFHSAEIKDIFKQAGLAIKKSFAVDYSTGAVRRSKYQGQLFYQLGHAR